MCVVSNRLSFLLPSTGSSFGAKAPRHLDAVLGPAHTFHSSPALSANNCVGLVLLLEKRNRVRGCMGLGGALHVAWPPGPLQPGRVRVGVSSLQSHSLFSGYDLRCALWGTLILFLPTLLFSKCIKKRYLHLVSPKLHMSTT